MHVDANLERDSGKYYAANAKAFEFGEPFT